MATKKTRKTETRWAGKLSTQPNYQYAEDLDAFLSRYADMRRVQREAAKRIKKMDQDKRKLEAMLASGNFDMNEVLGTKRPVSKRRNTAANRRSAARPVVQQVVPQPTIEPEPIVDRTPLDTTDTNAREWGLWNPTTAMASYQADAGLRRAAMQPVISPLNGVQLPQYDFGGYIGPIWPMW